MGNRIVKVYKRLLPYEIRECQIESLRISYEDHLIKNNVSDEIAGDLAEAFEEMLRTLADDYLEVLMSEGIFCDEVIKQRFSVNNLDEYVD